MDIEMWSYRVAVAQNEKQLVRVFPCKLFCCVIYALIKRRLLNAYNTGGDQHPINPLQTRN